MSKRLIVDLALTALPYLPIAIVAYGLWTGSMIVTWTGLGLLLALFVFALVGGLSFGVMIVLETARHWRSYSVAERWWRGMIAAWIAGGFLAIAVGAWAAYAWRTGFVIQLD